VPELEHVYEGVQVVVPGQLVQAPPPVPHAEVVLPATQVPLVEQQPPLQLVWLVLPHPVPQTFVDVLQAVFVGQSATALQPHAPLTQVDPLGLPLQLRPPTGAPVTDEQVPWLPARLHAWHEPVQEELQQ
jgi:hypothetical protein